MERRQIVLNGIPRHYWLTTPGASRAILVFLHGTGGTPSWVDSEIGWSQAAIQKGFTLVYPEGTSPAPAQPPSFLNNPLRWNDGSPNGSTADDVGFLEAMLDELASSFGQVPVFLSGFSNGGGMTYRFASERAGRIDAIAPVAGLCWIDPHPVRPVPSLCIMGTRDPLVPLRGGNIRSPWDSRLARRPPVRESFERWARAIGCSEVPTSRAHAESVTVDTYTGPVHCELMLVEDLGHHWPGGKGQLNPRIAGHPSRAIDATEVIWNFFQGFLSR